MHEVNSTYKQRFFMVQERRLSIKNHAEKHADSFSAPPYKSAEKLSQTYFELSLRYFKICLR